MSIVEAPEESSRIIAQHNLHPGSELIRFLLAKNLDYEPLPNHIRRWNGDEVQYCVDQLYELSCKSRSYDLLSRAELIAQMWSRSRAIPSVLQCAPITNVHPHPFKTSALSNIHRGYLNDGSSTTVALKAYRWGRQDNGLKIRKFFLEAEIWKSLSHSSILEFLGVHSQDGCLYLVSPFMKGSTLPEYMATNALSDSAIVEILAQVADGLAYLHARPTSIIHGDCRGANILVNERGDPVIADFGCSMIIRSNAHDPLPDWHHFSGSPRWTAPEKLRPSVHPIGTECDVYSFACLVLELLSGRLPFHHLQHDAAVVIEVLVRGRHPSCPDDIRCRELVDRVWPLLSRCWSHDPKQRPSITEVKEALLSELRIPSAVWS